MDVMERHLGADTVLFADTIMRNLAYGRPSASRAEILKAAGVSSSHHPCSLFACAVLDMAWSMCSGVCLHCALLVTRTG